ncbi:MAG: CAP domain-containing protein [Actinobacteria bacterium]|nr:MAG: CAP domain-containing protein [Actinomycetota bacterium]
MDSTLAADDALLYSDIPHRNVTLDRRFNTVGLGIALDSSNWVYVTEDFAQIPGWAAPQAAGSANVHAAVAPAPVARAPVAKTSVVTTNRSQVVAGAPAPAPVPAPVLAAAALAVPPAPAAPIVTAPAAQPITTSPVSRSRAHPGAKARSNPGSNSGGVWILLGLAAGLVAAFGGHRFRTMLARGRRQPPVATAPSPQGSTSSSHSWRQAA